MAILKEIAEDGRFTAQDLTYLTSVSENIKARTEYLRSQAADISSIAV